MPRVRQAALDLFRADGPGSDPAVLRQLQLAADVDAPLRHQRHAPLVQIQCPDRRPGPQDHARPLPADGNSSAGDGEGQDGIRHHTDLQHLPHRLTAGELFPKAGEFQRRGVISQIIGSGVEVTEERQFLGLAQQSCGVEVQRHRDLPALGVGRRRPADPRR